jgi:peptidoglycan/xylan/chitin deacetylase (PgdA/CDA1 family)
MISFRFDIDTCRGLLGRTPPLLDLLEEHGLRATFFCVMGEEPNFWEVLRLEVLGGSGARSALERRGGLLQGVWDVLTPEAVGHQHPEQLREIIDRGHELEPHGWSHIRWALDLDGIEVEEHLRLALRHHEEIVGHRAVGFASPGGRWDEDALRAFDAVGLRYAADMEGDEPFRPPGYEHLQLPVTRSETLSEMKDRGLDDDDIVGTVLGDIETHPDYCCIRNQVDDLDEGGLRILDRILRVVRERGLRTATLAEVADVHERSG